MEKKLRVAMLGHKRIPSREGGIEIVVEELSTRMVKLGYDVTCYNRRGHHVSGKEYDRKVLNEYKGIHLKVVPTIDRKGLAAITASFFAALRIAFGKYDVVHFHAEGPCAMMWLPKLFGKRCIATIHGLDHQRSKWGSLASSCIMFGEKCAVKLADEIIVLSQAGQRYFKQTYGRETTFIPNGVLTPTLREPELIKDKWGLEKDEYLLFLGRIVPEKGIKYLINAFKNVTTEKKLIIAGGKSDTNLFLKEMKALASDDKRIIFVGFVEGQLLEELYSNAYLYVLPSELEGMSLSLLEAMSYGNCCLVSNIDECVEVVKDKAFTFEQKNELDLRDKLQMLCDNELYVKSFQRTTGEFVCERYDWDNIVKQTCEIYERAK